MARLIGEEYTVQNPLVRYSATLARSAGVTFQLTNLCVCGKVRHGPLQHFREAGVEAETCIASILSKRIAKRLIKVLCTIESNPQVWKYLDGLRAVFLQAEKRERSLRLIDLEDIGKIHSR